MAATVTERQTYPMRFVRVTTSDSVPLDGVVFEPEGRPRGGVIVVHGAGSHFYQRLHQLLGIALAQAGYRAVAGNNRGHDLGAYLPNDGQERLLGGSAWERFADSVHDVRAWVDLVESELKADGRAEAPLCLIGHSLGAAKVAHYQATTRDPRVCAVVGCSGLAIGARGGRRWQPNEEQVQLVRHLVAQERGQQLLDPSFQRRYISAQTFLERYERFQAAADGPSDLARISVPLLALYATGEGGTPELMSSIRERATSAPRCDTFLVADADHDYHDHEAQAAGRIISWLEEVLPS